MNVKNIGLNAGVIWHLLFDNGKLTVRKIGEMTGYDGMNICLALGWLAREDKISFINSDGSIYFELNQPSNEYYF